MMTDEELLAGAQSDNIISEMDQQTLLMGDHESKREFKDEPLDDADDLYDAAIEPTSAGGVEKRESIDSNSVPAPVSNIGPVPTQTNSSTSISGGGSSRRFQLYVGNLSWWTTDDDIIQAIQSYGVTDIVDIKFAENRQNGQSRGFATIVVGSETSGKTIMDRLPGRQLHGNLISVLPYNKSSLQRLEEATKSSAPQEKKEEKSNIHNVGTFRIGPQSQMNMMNRPMQMGSMNGMMPMGYQQMPPNMMSMQPQQMMMQNQSMMGGPPPQIGHVASGPQVVSNASAAQAMNSLFRNQQPSSLAPPGTGLIAPGTHVNPHVYPNFSHMNQQRPDGYRQDISPAEYEEVMNRNKTVSSSAITRAMQDASDGDITSAVSTLNTAISLIRQSKVSGDEQCKALIRTLEDALSSVDSKSDHSSSRKHRRRSPSTSPRRRSRSRDRDSRSRRHGSKKRSRAY